MRREASLYILAQSCATYSFHEMPPGRATKEIYTSHISYCSRRRYDVVLKVARYSNASELILMNYTATSTLILNVLSARVTLSRPSWYPIFSAGCCAARKNTQRTDADFQPCYCEIARLRSMRAKMVTTAEVKKEETAFS